MILFYRMYLYSFGHVMMAFISLVTLVTWLTLLSCLSALLASFLNLYLNFMSWDSQDLYTWILRKEKDQGTFLIGRKFSDLFNLWLCPEKGDLHFHETVPETEAPSRDCVNALNGATFIST